MCQQRDNKIKKINDRKYDCGSVIRQHFLGNVKYTYLHICGMHVQITGIVGPIVILIWPWLRYKSTCYNFVVWISNKYWIICKLSWAYSIITAISIIFFIIIKVGQWEDEGNKFKKYPCYFGGYQLLKQFIIGIYLNK